MALPIEDYALIGNLRTAALVGKNGSIDWMCVPRFDSGACFTALVGTPDHGRWIITPRAAFQVTRKYREGTLVLETEFRTSQGRATLIDFMVPRTCGTDVIRIVRGIEGQVDFDFEMKLRFDYGSLIPLLCYGDHELEAVAAEDRVHLLSDVPLTGDNSATRAQFSVLPGEQVAFSFRWHPALAEQQKAIRKVSKTLEEVTSFWKQWSKRSTYSGKWKPEVDRSLITLKSLIHEPSGGIVASPTTSLPEKIGGSRNWDYRFCWLRDATFTLYSLSMAGYMEEAAAWRQWVIRSIRSNGKYLKIMYGLAGERRLTETEVSWLPGYENSKPVRIGNLAYNQVQLDVYGELMDAMHLCHQIGIRPDENGKEMQEHLLEHLEEIWNRPDRGIWETRGPNRQFTHSKVMAWVALDRAIRAAEKNVLSGPIDRWKALRTQIHEEVCRQGFNADIGAFTQYFGSKELDSSLLMIPLVGFLPVSDERILKTIEAVKRNLMWNGFLKRYETRDSENGDGLSGTEGVFLPCSFWLADNLCLLGRHDEAEELFERLLDLRNDVGLLSEEYDPVLKRQIGNFPQAFSHVSLVNSARNLCAAGGPAHHRGFSAPLAA